jgi:hypothetical protein
MWLQMIVWLMNIELWRSWEIKSVARSRHCPSICVGGPMRTTRNRSQDSRCPCRDSNRTPPNICMYSLSPMNLWSSEMAVFILNKFSKTQQYFVGNLQPEKHMKWLASLTRRHLLCSLYKNQSNKMKLGSLLLMKWLQFDFKWRNNIKINNAVKQR